MTVSHLAPLLVALTACQGTSGGAGSSTGCPPCPSAVECPKPATTQAPSSASAAVSVELPKASVGDSSDDPILVVTLTASGQCLWGQQALPACADLLPRAKERVAKNPDVRVTIHADALVAHGKVVEVLDLLKQAGITKIAFGVAPPPEPSAPPRP
jgi:biopolymer transport protein ExbD